MELYESHIYLENGEIITIWTDLGNQLEAAAICWAARTDTLTAESFCDYVNEKGIHSAFTPEQIQRA